MITFVIAKNSGFCFGVKRAIDNAFSLTGENNYVLGEIIHNHIITEKLSNHGVKTVNSLDELPKKVNNLLIRTHGEPKSVFEKAKKLDVNIIDCTCPFVRDIQKKVEEHYRQGYTIFILGDSNHPEIKGINGWCDNSAIISKDGRELYEIETEKLCIVVQTTFEEEKFNEIIKNFDNSKVKSVDIFNTICYTTTKRQKMAAYVSKIVSAVLVIGGANSNNTDNLFRICKLNCENVYRVTDTANFDYSAIKNYKRIGVVLGASTPIEQFQEVISKMEKVTEEIINTEVINDEQKEEVVSEVKVEAKAEKKAKEPKEFKSEMEAAFEDIKPSRDFKIGQVITAKISSANDNGLTLSIKNAKKDFELPKSELLEEGKYDKDSVGTEIRVMVVAKNPVKFSEKAMEKVLKEEAELVEIKNGKIFECEITETNKGGLIGKFGSCQVFVPASQIRIGFVKDLDKYIGKKIRLQAEKVESRGSYRQIVGSQRVILEKEKAERDAIRAEKEAEFFGNIQEGDIILGTPVRFAEFGAFVDVNGFDCLAHISDLSWTGCKNPADVLEIGKQYEFKILKIDVENKRVSIGYKQLQPKPWEKVAEKYNVGDIIHGKVVRIVSFGAFVEVEKGIDGLVHVSQITNKWLENPVTALQVGQEIDAKILNIDAENEKMNLSIKALLPEEEKPVEEKPAKEKKVKKEEVEEELHEWKDEGESGASIADMLNK